MGSSYLYLLALVLLLLPCSGAEISSFDGSGRLQRLLDGGEELAVRTSFGIATPGWKRIVTPWQGNRRSLTRNQQGVWRGMIEAGPENMVRVEQTTSTSGGQTRIHVQFKPEVTIEAEGVYFWIEVPRAAFAGGKVQDTLLGPAKPAGHDLLFVESPKVQFRNSDESVQINATLDRARPISIEDNWRTIGRNYAARIELQKGPLAKDVIIEFDLLLRFSAKPDNTPAELTVNAARQRYKLLGFGGNYCFNVVSPITDYTLQNLRQPWARTEMKLAEWAPENDTPGSRIRNDFLIQQKLTEKKIPYVISVWQLPEVFYTDPGPKPERRSNRHIAPDQWDALLKSMGDYLLYGKQKYGVEPDLFSFNEANIGIDVLLTPDEHRDAIKKIGAHFARLGLKTRMLLADATGPRGTHEFALTAANDPEAMKYVGAVGFHSWGGGTPDHYKAWGDLAEWLNLPLLVTELGLDAAAYRGRMYDSYYYGMQEVKMYQELLLHARPQALVYWEYTADYSTMRVNSDKPEPTARFWFLKHFSDLTPPNASALETASSNPKVLLTAFQSEHQYALHVANTGSARRVTITGLPAGLRSVRPIRTSETDDYKALPSIKVEKGRVQFDMPLQSLVTLTGTDQ